MKRKELETEYETLQRAQSAALKRVDRLEKGLERAQQDCTIVRNMYWEEYHSKRRWQWAFWGLFVVSALAIWLK